MATLFPGALDTTTQLPTTRTDASAMATNHASDHDTVDGAVLAVEAKLGSSSSTPAVGTALVSKATGVSTWQDNASTLTMPLDPPAVQTYYGPRLRNDMTAIAIYAKCIGGVSATVNVLHAAAPNGYLMGGLGIVAIAGSGWTAGTLAVTALSAGDSIDGVIAAMSGTPTDVLVQLEMRPT